MGSGKHGVQAVVSCSQTVHLTTAGAKEVGKSGNNWLFLSEGWCPANIGYSVIRACFLETSLPDPMKSLLFEFKEICIQSCIPNRTLVILCLFTMTFPFPGRLLCGFWYWCFIFYFCASELVKKKCFPLTPFFFHSFICSLTRKHVLLVSLERVTVF